MPWAFAYAPRGPVATAWTPASIQAFTERVRATLPSAAGRVSHLRIDPEIEADGPLDPGHALQQALRAAGWRPAPAIQPASTRVIDLRADEAALWGDLRKKWRQYVNKARTGGVVVVDADGDRLGEFYRIYQETAARAGFLIRTEAAYRDVWDAYRPAGRARLLFAQTADGEPVATLFLVRSGPRVVEPYGGMTAAGGGVAGQLPPEMGGDPDVARAGRDELRPVGPRDGRHRPFQDRVRWSRGPLHRGVGSRPRPARAPAYEAATGARLRWSRWRHGRTGTTGAAAFAGTEGGAD